MIKLKADGSGTIEQRLLLTEAAMEQLRGFAILSGGNAAGADPTSEAQARSLAGSLGPGVTYVSSTPVKTETAQGRDSVYAFTDITQLHFSEQPRLPGGMTFCIGRPPRTLAQITFVLTRDPDGKRTAPHPGSTVRSPAHSGGPEWRRHGPDRTTDRHGEEHRSPARGSRWASSPKADLVRTSSPFVDGNRVTLIDLDFDKAAADPDLATKLQSLKTRTTSRRQSPASRVSGSRSIPRVSIAFAPQ